jgi:hypothetical protein
MLNNSKTFYTDYEIIFNERLDSMIDSLGATDFNRFPDKRPIASLIYLQKLLTDNRGHLYGLRVTLHEDLSGRRMLYDQGGTNTLLKLDYRLIDAFEKVRKKTDNNRLNRTIDCFLIHEFLHFAQGMSEGRHSDLSRQSPDNLLAIDFQADALSVIATTVLAWISPEKYPTAITDPNNFLWQLYEISIDAVINQMEVFTHLMQRNLDRKSISEMSFSLDKIKRTALWHYQFHRAKNFNRDRSLADFQILSQPRLHFRNLEAAWAYNKSVLRKSWPDEEELFIQKTLQHMNHKENGFEVYQTKDPRCILSATSQYGTTRFVRIDATADTYRSAFKGFFECDLEKSKEFFEDIFQTEKWLIGKADGGDDSGPGNFGGSDGPGPIDRGPGGFPVDLSEEVRMEILFRYLQSTMFPLTVMVGA